MCRKKSFCDTPSELAKSPLPLATKGSATAHNNLLCGGEAKGKSMEKLRLC